MTRIAAIAWCALVLALPAVSGSKGAGETPVRRLGRAELPRGVPVAGDLIAALAWSDAGGERLAVFQARASGVKSGDQESSGKRIQVDTYVTMAGGHRLVRAVKDGVDDCPFDLRADFLASTIGVTDLDGDGTAELTFAYALGCKSDVSPDGLKLLVLEGKTKYIIRGTTIVDAGEGPVGGERSFEPKPARWPPAFLDHAAKVWKSVAVMKP